MSTLGGMGNGIVNNHKFDVNTSIPDLSSKVIIVTGGNLGIGKESVLQLAKHNPKKLYLAARSQEKFDKALAEIKEKVPNAKVEFLQLDLASFTSIKSAADKVLAENSQLDLLLNNAGIMGVDSGMTKEGYEVHFGVNHMGTVLLTRSLLPLLEKTADQAGSDVRIVNVSSTANTLVPSIPLNQVKSNGNGANKFALYGASKQGNVIHAKQLAKRYPKILSVSLHPGRVATTITDHFVSEGGPLSWIQRSYDYLVGTLTIEQGALNQLWASTWKRDDIVNGDYYTPVGLAGERRLGKNAKSEKAADELWDWQEAEFRSHGY
jgi:NAD(P)-dependent dehydrogenase (short-subunit alcohol dehydrogenase family)